MNRVNKSHKPYVIRVRVKSRKRDREEKRDLWEKGV